MTSSERTTRLGSGQVLGSDAAIAPYLWLGFTDDQYSENLWTPQLLDKKARRDWKKGLPPRYRELSPGQFAIDHEYAGDRCESVTLAGAIFPLATCENGAVSSRLLELEDRLARTVFRFCRTAPSLTHLNAIRKHLMDTGPLDCNRHFREADESFITFDLSDECLHWITKNFFQVFELDDPSSHESQFHPTKCGRAAFDDCAQFFEWMGVGEHRPFWKDRMLGALCFSNAASPNQSSRS
jgi:hypothetical protein